MTEKYHQILTRSPDFASAKENVLSFFKKTMLLHYDHMEFVINKSHQGNDAGFWSAVEEGLDGNRQALNGFIQDLQEEGFQTMEDLKNMEQGYPSKVFHIIAHLLDGFVGIDTVFYNLLEDSHGITAPLKKTIRKEAQNYWLIYLEVSFTSTSTASLIHGE